MTEEPAEIVFEPAVELEWEIGLDVDVVFVPAPSGSLVDELLAERRAEAEADAA